MWPPGPILRRGWTEFVGASGDGLRNTGWLAAVMTSSPSKVPSIAPVRNVIPFPPWVRSLVDLCMELAYLSSIGAHPVLCPILCPILCHAKKRHSLDRRIIQFSFLFPL